MRKFYQILLCSVLLLGALLSCGKADVEQEKNTVGTYMGKSKYKYQDISINGQTYCLTIDTTVCKVVDVYEYPLDSYKNQSASDDSSAVDGF